MSPDRSIYDLAKVVFARSGVMLKEHFRCVAPIIEYSKREFYAHELRPLRLARSSERLDPPLIDLISDARRENGVNRAEVEFIVGEIKALAADPKMHSARSAWFPCWAKNRPCGFGKGCPRKIGPDSCDRAGMPLPVGMPACSRAASATSSTCRWSPRRTKWGTAFPAIAVCAAVQCRGVARARPDDPGALGRAGRVEPGRHAQAEPVDSFQNAISAGRGGGH